MNPGGDSGVLIPTCTSTSTTSGTTTINTSGTTSITTGTTTCGSSMYIFLLFLFTSTYSLSNFNFIELLTSSPFIVVIIILVLPLTYLCYSVVMDWNSYHAYLNDSEYFFKKNPLLGSAYSQLVTEKLQKI